jgi:hypothetical protein
MQAKKLSFMTTFCMLFTAMAFAEATSTSIAENDDRLYIESAIVHIGNQGIFLNLHEKVLPITGIAQDEKGVYATVDSAAVDMTTCRRCGKDYDADNQSKKCPHGWILVR